MSNEPQSDSQNMTSKLLVTGWHTGLAEDMEAVDILGGRVRPAAHQRLGAGAVLQALVRRKEEGVRPGCGAPLAHVQLGRMPQQSCRQVLHRQGIQVDK